MTNLFYHLTYRLGFLPIVESDMQEPLGVQNYSMKASSGILGIKNAGFPVSCNK